MIELDLREGEYGALVRDRDVRAGVEAGTAAECVPQDARDGRRGRSVDGLEHAAQRIRVGHVRVVVEVDGGAHPRDVGAGAEARPSPASTTARALPTSTNAAASSAISDASNAFRVSGRTSVTPEHVRPFDPERCHRAHSRTRFGVMLVSARSGFRHPGMRARRVAATVEGAGKSQR